MTRCPPGMCRSVDMLLHVIALDVCRSPDVVKEHIAQSSTEAQVEDEELGAAP